MSLLFLGTTTFLLMPRVSGGKHSSWYLFVFVAVAGLDGVFISNGPGDPAYCTKTSEHVGKFMASELYKPVFGICLGHQLLCRGIGAQTFKLK